MGSRVSRLMAIVGTTLLCGCASFIDIRGTESPPEGEAIVFGRFIPYSSVSPSNLGNVYGGGIIKVLNEGTSRIYKANVEFGEVFFWRLEPGNYVIVSLNDWFFESAGVSIRRTGVEKRIMAAFSIEAKGRAVYIGTLALNFDTDNKYVIDEYEIALKLFYPKFRQNVAKRLMVLEVPK